jgi:hypothetical protein
MAEQTPSTQVVPFQVPVYEEEFCTPEAAVALAAIKAEWETPDTGRTACIRIPVRLIKGDPVPEARFDMICGKSNDLAFEQALHLMEPKRKDLFYRAAMEAMPGNASTFLWSRYADGHHYTAPKDLELNMLYLDGALMIYHEDPVKYYQENNFRRHKAGRDAFLGAVCTIFTLPATSGHERLLRLRQRDICLSFFRRLVFLEHAGLTLEPTLADIQPERFL